VYGKGGTSTQIYNSGRSLVAALTTDPEKGRDHAQPSISTIMHVFLHRKRARHSADMMIDFLRARKRASRDARCLQVFSVLQPCLKNSLSA
jgi:hypothetical protein